MAYTRANLVTEALGNLGIILQVGGSEIRSRADLVIETLGNLGIVRQTDGSQTHTRIDLVSRAAEILGVLPSGQTLSAEDSAIIDDHVESVIADLNARTVVTISNSNAVPGSVFEALATVLAAGCRGSYESSPQLANEALVAEAKLRNFGGADIVDEKLPSIMDELNARMIATVDLNAIPSAWYSALADICAESVKGKFFVRPEILAQLPIRAARSETILKNLNRSIIVDRNLDAILAEIATDDLVMVVDDSDIPQEWFTSLAAIVADRVKGNFELTPDVIMRVKAEGAEAVNTLRRTTRGRPSYNRAVPEWI